jgi:2-polyprenyl-6-methoxyphenol hydroxylase-like FAD-dependent oxidoreductase
MKTLPADVLVCGAGPTGLMLALRLARAGVRVRIVDPAAEPGTTSRALVVHARTLELYRQIGLADAFLQESVRFTAVNLWVRGRRRARVEIGAMGQGLTPYPEMMVCPQDRHERFLIHHLGEAGVHVERGVELVDLQQDGARVVARLQAADGASETCAAAYLAGCDGARSRVRDVIAAGFPGGTYSRVFYVADVEGTGPAMNGELHVALDDTDFLAVFPLRGGRTARFVGTVQAEHEDEREGLSWDDVGRHVAARLGLEVAHVNWFSTYRVHHRVAGHFRSGRVFLLGDAAHIHSPVGGQGLNTGLGDAANLAWKLADVLGGRAHEALLDSYEPERRAFALQLVATTDRGFVVAVSPGRLARFVRTRLVPLVLPLAVRLRSVRRLMFRTLSQTAIHYRACTLNEGEVGPLHGGDRLPWYEIGEGSAEKDNHVPLDGIRWQVHVYGMPSAPLADACAGLGLPLHAYRWERGMARAGLTRNAVYLVRPDGYVALADPKASPERLRGYVERLRGGHGSQKTAVVRAGT